MRATLAKLIPQWPAAVAIILCFAAAGLRLASVKESLWLDELHTAWCAVGTLGEVAPRAAIGNQPPLFFWLEWLLVGFLGPSEFSLRLPSIVAGSLLPLAAFLLARRWSTACVGLVAAALIAVDPTEIRYATEARSYALLQLLAVIHIAITAELISQPMIALRVGWVAVAALLFYLHFTAALMIPAELTFYVLMKTIRPQSVAYRWTSLALDVFILAVICLPAMGTLQAIFARRKNWDAFIELRSPLAIVEWWPYILGLGYVAAALATDRLIVKAKDTSAAGHRQLVFAALLVCWLLVPALLTWIAAETGIARLFYDRYLLICAPAAVLLAAWSVDFAPWRWAKLAVGVLLVTTAIWLSDIYPRLYHEGRVIKSRGEDWRGCVAWLDQQLPQTQFPVLVDSVLIEADALREPHDELLEDYCLLPVNSLYPLDVDRSDMFALPMHEPSRLDQVVEMLVVHRGGAWLIVRGNQQAGQRLAGRIAAHLESSNAIDVGTKWQIQESRSFGHVQVFLLTTDGASHGSALNPAAVGP